MHFVVLAIAFMISCGLNLPIGIGIWCDHVSIL